MPRLTARSSCSASAPAPRGPLPGPLPPEALPLHAWPAQGRARAVILALHGFGDAGDLTFEGAARAWSARGIAVYAPDQRGFGANREPPRLARRRRPHRRRRRPLPLAPRPLPRPPPRRRRPLHGRRHRPRRRRRRASTPTPSSSPAPPSPAATRSTPSTAPPPASPPPPRPSSAGPAAASSTSAPPTTPRPSPASVADPRHFGDPTSRELYGLVQLMDAPPPPRPAVDAPRPSPSWAPTTRSSAPPRSARSPTRIPGRVGFILYPDGWHWLFRDLQAPRVWQDVGDFVLSAADLNGPEPARGLPLANPSRSCQHRAPRRTACPSTPPPSLRRDPQDHLLHVRLPLRHRRAHARPAG